MGVTGAAAKNVDESIAANSKVTQLFVPLDGARDVRRETLGADGEWIGRSMVGLVSRLTSGSAEAQRLFAAADRCYMTVLRNPNEPALRLARWVMTKVDEDWGRLKPRLEAAMIQQMRSVAGAVEKDITQSVRARLKRLDEIIQKHYGAIQTMEMPADPEKLRKYIQKKLGPNASVDDVNQAFDLWNIPFNSRAVREGAPEPGRGLALRGEVLDYAARRARARELQKADAILVAYHRLAEELAPGERAYDEVVDIIGDFVTSRQAADKSVSIEDPDFLKGLIDRVQGHLGEALALRHPEFLEKVWRPAERVAQDLADKLNAGNVVPPWRVEVITEPAWATTRAAEGATKGGPPSGELLDSGVWLIREGEAPQAMPVFILEVKSGDVRGAIPQIVKDRGRSVGGVVELQLPRGHGLDGKEVRRYTMRFPPHEQMGAALATTRSITDKRVLDQVTGKGSDAVKGLGQGEELVLFHLPLSQDELRAAAEALVLAHLMRP